jgi:hypothetical protein
VKKGGGTRAGPWPSLETGETTAPTEWKTNALNIPQVKLNIIKMDRLA